MRVRITRWVVQVLWAAIYVILGVGTCAVFVVVQAEGGEFTALAVVHWGAGLLAGETNLRGVDSTTGYEKIGWGAILIKRDTGGLQETAILISLNVTDPLLN